MLHDAADRAQVRRELAAELMERMDRAEETYARYEASAVRRGDWPSAAALRSKAAGMALARSIVEELLCEDSTT